MIVMNEIILALFSVSVGVGLGTTLLAIFSKDVQAKIKMKHSTAKWASVFLFLLLILSLWYDTPTSLGSYVYIERDLPNHKSTIHSSSSCPRIKKGYSVNEVKYYTYTPYVDCFCSRCFYESDVIKLTKGEK